MHSLSKDYETPRGVLELLITTKFSYLCELPWRLAAVALDDEDEAREQAQRCFGLYASASKDYQTDPAPPFLIDACGALSSGAIYVLTHVVL